MVRKVLNLQEKLSTRYIGILYIVFEVFINKKNYPKGNLFRERKELSHVIGRGALVTLESSLVVSSYNDKHRPTM